MDAEDVAKLGVAGFVFLALFYFAQQLITNASKFFANTGFAQVTGIAVAIASFIIAGLFVKWVAKWF